jgi:hypothetical protein
LPVDFYYRKTVYFIGKEVVKNHPKEGLFLVQEQEIHPKVGLFLIQESIIPTPGVGSYAESIGKEESITIEQSSNGQGYGVRIPYPFLRKA